MPVVVSTLWVGLVGSVGLGRWCLNGTQLAEERVLGIPNSGTDYIRSQRNVSPSWGPWPCSQLVCT